MWIGLFFLLALFTEAITELVTKSKIFFFFRKFLIERFDPLGALLTCGYCFSFWSAALTVFLYFNYLPVFFNDPLLDLLLNWIILQRLSNFIHGISDRYFDKRYDLRYNK